jgi:hypothetical protein
MAYNATSTLMTTSNAAPAGDVAGRERTAASFLGWLVPALVLQLTIGNVAVDNDAALKPSRTDAERPRSVAS